MTKFFTIICFLYTLSIAAASEEKYFGEKSTEAILTFKGQANVSLKGEVTLAKLLASKRMKAAITEEIQNQVFHLMGSFQGPTFEEKFGYKAVLGEDSELKIKAVTKTKSTYRKLIDYTFKGKVVADIRAFKLQDVLTIPIVLPLAYDKIYKLALNEDGDNLCTDEHYDTEDDFFYFWNPDQKGCPLRGNDKDVLRLEGKLKIIKNTVDTYPEYDLLYKTGQENAVLNISVFLGYIEDIEQYSKPNFGDDGYLTFKSLEDYLVGKGYKVENKKEAFKLTESGKEKFPGINFYGEFKKRIKTQLGNYLEVRLKVLLSDTGIDSKDTTFHQYLIPGLEQSDILVYDGHSGLGANLSLDYLPEVNFNKKLYQLFFFNGCSSYPYYNHTYFEAKGSSKYLDIMTSGLPTITSTMFDNMQAFLTPFILGHTDSYKKLIKRLERSNGEEGTYLTGVNGDEDNKFRL